MNKEQLTNYLKKTNHKALFKNLRRYIINKDMQLTPYGDSFFELIITDKHISDLFTFEENLIDESAYFWAYYQSIVEAAGSDGLPINYELFQRYIKLFQKYFKGVNVK